MKENKEYYIGTDGRHHRAGESDKVGWMISVVAVIAAIAVWVMSHTA